MRHPSAIVLLLLLLACQVAAFRPLQRLHVPVVVPALSGERPAAEADRSQRVALGASTVAMSVLLGHGDVAAAADLSALVVARGGFDFFVNTLSLLFLCRTVLSWYPKTNLNEFPYNVAAWPTEPLLAPVRSLIPPAFGVDVSSIVWVLLLSFLREILTGQQGIITLLEKS